jgi:hypothetical protein
MYQSVSFRTAIVEWLGSSWPHSLNRSTGNQVRIFNKTANIHKLVLALEL